MNGQSMSRDIPSKEDFQRARELYRYFQPKPTYSSSEYLSYGQGSQDATFPTSPNASLTAYAQLVALRLNAQRAIISLADLENLYDIAEATRTLNIGNTRRNNKDGDASWVGRQRITKEGRLCAYTVALPQPASGYSFFVVNDLSKDERFADLPFVAGPPYFRFYAGTPITTKNRINIGNVFVLDDKPRDGLNEEERDLLGTMASVSLSYLEVHRDAVDGRRVAKMAQGLKYFIDGKPSFVIEDSGDELSSRRQDQDPLDINDMGLGTSYLPQGNLTSRATRRSLPDTTLISQSERDTISKYSGSQGQEHRHKLRKIAYSESQSRGWIFARAANLLREGLDLDNHGGVAFFDCVRGSLDHSEPKPDESFNASNDQDEGFDTPGLATTTAGFDPSTNSFRTPNVDANLLASSTGADPLRVGNEPESEQKFKTVSLKFIRSLLKRYPGGKLFTFEDFGVPAQPEIFNSEAEKGGGRVGSVIESVDDPTVNEHRHLQELFPNVRHLVFAPLWDAANGQWASGCFCWNTIESTVFTPDVELDFTVSFGKSVMAEMSRLDTIDRDKQKGDFIGSISHELRSPLHGILASLEFLQESGVDPFQRSLIDTIETCSRTLLDTINHVLDYTKINLFERNWRTARKSSPATEADATNSLTATTTPAVSQESPSLLNIYAITNVAAILEEVIESTAAGHFYSDMSPHDITDVCERSSGQSLESSDQDTTKNRRSVGSHKDVEIILDVEQGNWNFVTQPGALRRCFMNIFGNALKYTDSGTIKVRLEIQESPQYQTTDSRTGSIINFKVTDTGKGISADYLRSKLFTPFAQEDPISPGTGLGLSMVRTITKMLGGKVDIKSRIDQGTTVIISIPLRRPNASDEKATPTRTMALSQSAQSDILTKLKSQVGTRTVAIYGFDSRSQATHDLKQSVACLSKYISEWFGLEILPWKSGVTPADVIITDEADLSETVDTAKAAATLSKRALVVLCPGASSYSQAKFIPPDTGLTVQFISKPCGPYKLAKALSQAVAQLELPEAATSSTNDYNETPSAHRLGSYHLRKKSVGTKTESLPSSQQILALRSASLLRNGSREPENSVGASRSSSPTSRSISHKGLDFSESGSSMITKAATPDPEKSRGQQPRQAPPTSKVLERPRILLVEDNKINLRLLQTYMKRRKYHDVDSAENGKLALEAVENAAVPYDIIFMDISMPIMNGFEATVAIRSVESKAGLEKRGALIVALTGLASERDQTEAFESGVDIFMVKPVSFKEVEKLLDKWQTENSTTPEEEKADMTSSG